MIMPDNLMRKSYVEWNYLVRGLIEVWDRALGLGLEQIMEEQISRDTEGMLTEWLGHFGNELRLIDRLDTSRWPLRPSTEMLLAQALCGNQDQEDSRIAIDIRTTRGGADIGRR